MTIRLSYISLFVCLGHAALILSMALFSPAPLIQTARPRIVVQTVSLKKKKMAPKVVKEAVEAVPVVAEAVDVEAMPRLEESSVKAAEVEPLPQRAKSSVKTAGVEPLPQREKSSVKAALPRREKSSVKAAGVEPLPQREKSSVKAALPQREKSSVKAAGVELLPRREVKKEKQASQPKKTAKSPAPQPKKGIKAAKNSAQQAKSQALLAKAQESIAKIRPTGVKIDANQKGKELQIPQLRVAQEETWSPGEISYRDELAGRLKLQLKLPEYGSVKLKLTLKRSGSVSNVAILSAASTANRSYVQKMLPTLQFPPFGHHFGIEAEHTFTIALDNDF